MAVGGINAVPLLTQVLIRWAIQRSTSVLPKSTNPERIASNLAVLNWSLDDADMATLSDLEYQARMVDGAFLLSPAGPYRCALGRASRYTLIDLYPPQQAPQRITVPKIFMTALSC